MLLKLFFVAVICSIAAVVSLEKWAGFKNADADVTSWLEWFHSNTWERHMVAGAVVGLAGVMSLMVMTAGRKE